MLALKDLNFKKTFYQLSHTNEVTLVENIVARCQTKSFKRSTHSLPRSLTISLLFSFLFCNIHMHIQLQFSRPERQETLEVRFFLVVFTPIQIFSHSKLSFLTKLYKSCFNASLVLCFLVKLYFEMNSDGTSKRDPRGEKQHKLAVLDQNPQYPDRKGRVRTKYGSRGPTFKTL